MDRICILSILSLLLGDELNRALASGLSNAKFLVFGASNTKNYTTWINIDPNKILVSETWNFRKKKFHNEFLHYVSMIWPFKMEIKFNMDWKLKLVWKYTNLFKPQIKNYD